jgi:PKD repeat protein
MKSLSDRGELMKKRVLPVFFAVLALATLQFGQQLGNPTLIYHADYGVRWTQCAFGPDSSLWVVWVPGDANPNSGGPVYVANFDGTTTTTPYNVTNSDFIQANRPHIAVSTTGDVLVTWGTISNNSTFARVYDHATKTWGAIETVFDGDAHWEPCGQIDKDGNLHIVSNVYAGGRSFARSKINGVWEDVYPLTQGYGEMSAIALDSSGVCHAILIEKQDNGDYQLYYTSRTNSQIWYTREPIPGQYGSAALPWIAAGPNNIAVAVWMDYGDTTEEGGVMIQAMRIQSGAQSQTALDFYMQHFPRVVVDTNNNVHVAVQAGAGDAGDGFRYTNNVGGTWKQVQTIAGNAAKVVGLAADVFGNVAVSMSSWLSYSLNLGTDIIAYSIEPIVATPLPTAEFTFSPTTGYPPLSVTFEATPSYGLDGQEVNYDWVFGDGGTAEGRVVTHVFELSGTFNVRLTVVDDNGRENIDIQPIEIKKTNPLIPLNVSAAISISGMWTNPSVAFTFSWSINPDNIPEHIQGYAIYMKEGNGAYTKVKTVNSSSLSTTVTYTDMKKKRSFAITTLGYGGTESPMVYFQ